MMNTTMVKAMIAVIPAADDHSNQQFAKQHQPWEPTIDGQLMANQQLRLILMAINGQLMAIISQQEPFVDHLLWLI